jgi:hypothetical protein
MAAIPLLLLGQLGFGGGTQDVEVDRSGDGVEVGPDLPAMSAEYLRLVLEHLEVSSAEVGVLGISGGDI